MQLVHLFHREAIISEVLQNRFQSLHQLFRIWSLFDIVQNFQGN